jgi:hypothetical protein
MRYNLLFITLIAMVFGCGFACDDNDSNPVSASGVRKADIKINTGADGLTTEQRNVQDRIKIDNEPGSIKHLYVISAYSGQVLVYSTVRGKVTSSGKRLTPTTINGSGSDSQYTIPIYINNNKYYTTEVLQDDGTYGSSVEYLYWWDTKGVYHQHYVSGGQILHVANQPIAVKRVVINMENETHDVGIEENSVQPPAKKQGSK